MSGRALNPRPPFVRLARPRQLYASDQAGASHWADDGAGGLVLENENLAKFAVRDDVKVRADTCRRVCATGGPA